ncbi:hypothetical protein CALCODRAFT_504845 [Calocera cornea HHB12733]|uniref:Helicase ATP-binding domain-containing protein n=1 Tax=Calocera cornea HHB12733 TaxID=1353952 RepID=A0A165C6I1_9BASI|nr:hypothetical protein CALCODRAFT_504845 [Calocera cornea HHB12733]
MSGPIDSYVRLTNPGRTASREEAMHLVRERHNAMIKQAEKGAFKDAGKRLVLGPSAAVARIEDEYRTRPTFDWILPSTDVIEQGIQAKKDRGDAMKQAMVRAGNEDERRALAWETRVTEREIANIEAAIGLAPNKEVEGIEDLNAMRALQGASQTGDITEQCLRAMERLGVKPGQKWPVGMKTALMPHQIFAVWWMAHQERHTPYHGSFLADDMGLGKTVSGIAVIKYTLPTRPKNKPGTLVVAPASIITQWTQEVQKHSNLTVLAWRERTRVDGSNGLRLLSQFDVIVTSYEQMVIEWEAKGPLYRAHWFRVVWDECQLLRNKMSKRSQASCNLKAQYRLLMSGTPIQNKLEEAFPHFRTLGLPVLRTEDGFHDAIGGKTGRAGPAALSVVYKAHLLRRVQETLFEGEPIVNLLPKEQVEIRVVLGPERAAEYRSRRAKDKREWIERTEKKQGC